MPWPDVLDLCAYWGKHPPEHVIAHDLAVYFGVYKRRAGGPVATGRAASAAEVGDFAGVLGLPRVDLSERNADGTKRALTREQFLMKARRIGIS